jgi:acetoin utilization deacetylase AcuC-like enzyme
MPREKQAWTGYVYDPRHRGHDHAAAPEAAARLDHLMGSLMHEAELDQLREIEVGLIPWNCVAAVHTGRYLDALGRLKDRGAKRISLDTYMTEGTLAAALVCASAAVSATRAVLDGRVRNAFSLMRPPGHHALPGRAMGYCIFNNAAIAAAYALRERGLQRVMIVDVDAHHGNGTQEVFYASPDVLFVSLHQYPWFPGSGDWIENGVEAGLGYTYNVPLPQWAGDEMYLQAFDRLVAPLAERYRPELILASAGFDAHWRDHSSVLGLSVRGYYDVTERLRMIAGSVCEGRLVLLLEGGYNLGVLGACARAALRALRQAPPPADPFGPCPDRPVGGIDDVLDRLVGFMQLMDPGQDFFAQDAVAPYPLKP